MTKSKHASQQKEPQERWRRLNEEITSCARCPRLVRYCAEVAKTKRKAFAHEMYWGKPVPNFGPAEADLLIVGLAPAAHGANRTGRMFTGDRSGDWLYRSLHRNGFASQAQATSADDGLRLITCAVTATAHCAPPDNKPTPAELARCSDYLEQTLQIAPARVIVALGQIAWTQTLLRCAALGWRLEKGAQPKFAHGAEVALAEGRVLLASYHPSQQNTFTGRLTEDMLDGVFARASTRLLPAALAPRGS